MDIVDIQAVESKLSDVTVTAIPMIPKQNSGTVAPAPNTATTTSTATATTNNNNTSSNNNNNNQPPGQSKYAQLLGVIEEMGREVRPTYAGSKSSAERLKRGIVHARILVRECLMETERSARQ